MLLTPLKLATLTLASPLLAPEPRPPRPLTLPPQAPPQAYRWQEPPTRQSSRYPFSTAAATATRAGAKPSPWSSDIEDYGTWLTVHPLLLTLLRMLRLTLIGANVTKRPTSN